MSSKEEALEFLRTLESTIRAASPKGTAMEASVRAIVAEAKTDPARKHLRLPEAAFLTTYVVPQIHKLLMTEHGMTSSQAREAVLNEYHRSMPEYSRYSPIHAARHPFKKLLGLSAEGIYRQWMDPQKGDGLTQSCPDFALRAPFPHSIVFEGKYFSKGSADVARRDLVADLYQAFFYRGLPKTPSVKGRPEWEYDYACLVAFDGSRDGTLLSAWKSLNATVRKSFWSGANIYVMILRG